jgi:hypothetical protein
MFEMNRTLQAEVSGRAQYIQQTVQLEALIREIVTAIANLVTRNNDNALRTVLSQHGITINPAGTAVTAPQTGTNPTWRTATTPGVYLKLRVLSLWS